METNHHKDLQTGTSSTKDAKERLRREECDESRMKSTSTDEGIERGMEEMSQDGEDEAFNDERRNGEENEEIEFDIDIEDEEESTVFGLSKLPCEWITKIMSDPFGIDDVFDEAAAIPLPNRTLKCLLLLKLRRDEAHACLLCGFVFFNYIHYLIHLSEDKHIQKVNNSGNLRMFTLHKDYMEVFEKDIQVWKKSDHKFIEGKTYWRELKQKSGDFNRKRRPSIEYLRYVPKFGQVSDPNTNWTSKKKEFIMDSLIHNLESGIPICIYCKDAFRCTDEYLNHCLSYGHYKNVSELEENDSSDVGIMNLTILTNLEIDKSPYYEFMEGQNDDNVESAEKCWKTVMILENSLPRKEVTRHSKDPQRDAKLLENILPKVNGKSVRYLENFPDAIELHEILEPQCFSFKSHTRRLRLQFSEYKVPFHFASKINNEELDIIYTLYMRTLDNGIPHCLYCDLLFSSQEIALHHFLSTQHLINYASYCTAVPNSLELCFDSMQMMLLEHFNRKKVEENRLVAGPLDEFDNRLVQTQLSHRCGVCNSHFVDFSYFIAHFWSHAHLSRLPPLNDPHFIPFMIKNATKEQLSRISQEVEDKYGNEEHFCAQNYGDVTNDYYLTLYVQFHFRRKFEVWTKVQMNYERKKGIYGERNEKSVPSIEFENEMDEKMKRRYTRAEYHWNSSSDSLESSQFNSFYSAFPPLLIWNEFDSHMKQKDKIPFCSHCELSFSNVLDYYLHFGQDSHPLPNLITDEYAGLTLLIHIMYRERKEIYDPEKYSPLSPL
ncbi:hypothetical protein PFISCL1PPCAC_15137 [Pristionchus fissidentatus]|uniref:C2H2-type domain-containing protein n=1 Tax=Pristionchus fissidentatus TaxID=1538716 RepID=A0AAV5VWD2_9BILA|nr:hypothetical protein PFISCL1PPCAC_15137 [Pristionchus fissidentatus]